MWTDDFSNWKQLIVETTNTNVDYLRMSCIKMLLENIRVLQDTRWSICKIERDSALYRWRTNKQHAFVRERFCLRKRERTKENQKRTTYSQYCAVSNRKLRHRLIHKPDHDTEDLLNTTLTMIQRWWCCRWGAKIWLLNLIQGASMIFLRDF